MDYEKKYKEALERAKKLGTSEMPIDTKRNFAEQIFPELAESEDEKIRKGLIEYFSFNKDGSSHALDHITPKQVVAWLEKQGKQKSVWSEDDKAILKAIMQDIQERHPDAMWGIDTSKTAAVSTEFIIKFLKSLSPQLHWKPTEEQMKAFEHFVRSIGESGYASPYDNNTKLIYSLLNDLKNL